MTIMEQADRRTGREARRDRTARPSRGYPPAELAERLDRDLGDPHDASTVFNYEDAVAQDVREEFPERVCSALNAWGLADYYVPEEYGGSLTGYEDLLALIRTVARRDLTAAIGHGKTFLGSVCVWVAGDHAAGVRLGAMVREGAQVSLGLTERSHGSDLMAGELTAEPADGNYRISGEKWLINNATRGRLLTLLARTSPVGGPRGFSLLLVDKETLPPGTYRCSPKVPTLGIRGADISGIVFDGAPVDRWSLVGREGEGSELLLKSLQITRTLCPALSLGAADHALRLAVRFTRERELYGRSLGELPLVRRTLAEAYTDVLVCEAVATVATRSIQGLTSELSVTAAVAKYLVPSTVDDVVHRLGSVLGARSFLAGHYAHGMFQKVERDHRIVGIFDGNTLVNLYSLVAQFRTLARNYLGPLDNRPRLRQVFDLEHELPPLRPEHLALFSRYGSSVLGSLPDSVAALRDAERANPALAGAARCAELIAEAATALHQRIRTRIDTVAGASEISFEDAKRYALVFAGACCLGLWLHSHRAAERGRTGELWRDGLWLNAALARLLDRLAASAPPEQTGLPEPPPHDLFDRLLDRLTTQYEEGDLFSLLPCRTAEGPPC